MMAEKFLRLNCTEILKFIEINIETIPAKWNPLGFIVFQLGIDTSGNSLRLHVWPKNNRKISTHAPGIHCHAWYLTSLMLKGGYVDKHYNAIEYGYLEEKERIEKNLLRKFILNYHENGTTSLINRGECVDIVLRDVIIARKGTIQNIKDSIFHAPDVPLDQDVVTLVIDSAQLGYPTTALLNCDQDFPTNSRKLVTQHERNSVRILLNEILKDEDAKSI